MLPIFLDPTFDCRRSASQRCCRRCTRCIAQASAGWLTAACAFCWGRSARGRSRTSCRRTMLTMSMRTRHAWDVALTRLTASRNQAVFRKNRHKSVASRKSAPAASITAPAVRAAPVLPSGRVATPVSGRSRRGCGGVDADGIPLPWRWPSGCAVALADIGGTCACAGSCGFSSRLDSARNPAFEARKSRVARHFLLSTRKSIVDNL